MRAYRLNHLRDSVLLRELTILVEQDRENTAKFLACIAEVDERRLYLPAGYPSMYAYCLGELHLSEDAAYLRIGAARTAREFPALLGAISEGRIHLTAIRLLSPHLKPGNVGELIAAATHKGRADIELWLARRFPRPEALRIDDGVSPLPNTRLVPVHVGEDVVSGELGPGQVEPKGSAAELVPERVDVLSPPTHVSPFSPDRYALQITLPRATHDKLRYAQSLLGHAFPSGDIAGVLDRALDSLIIQLEKRKLGATTRPRRQPRPTRTRRHIPAQVRRAVWERDQGQCTFVGDRGRRCGARTRLEFDHVDPVARGGWATAERMRLRCRGHNQFEAERVFGAEFMRRKRSAASDRPRKDADADDQTLDVIAGLRALGLRAIEARHIAQAPRLDHPLSLEERMRLALRAHRPRGTVQVGAHAPAPATGRPGGAWSQASAGP